MRKILYFILIVLILISGFGTVASNINQKYTVKKINEVYNLSDLTINNIDQYISVSIKQATSSVFNVGDPNIPILSKVFTLPYGSKIDQVEVIYSNEKIIELTKKISPVLQPEFLSSDLSINYRYEKNSSIYESKEFYPKLQYTTHTGAGLKDDTHVTYIIVDCYPVKYSPKNNLLYYSNMVEINILYQEPIISVVYPDNYDLIIIAPEEFSSAIQPLISHKEDHNIKTLFKSLEEIYLEYYGRDDPEKIKYFIKETAENFGASYVLLIGGINKIPIRTSSVKLWNRWQEDTITDLYYSDILDINGNFSSWDSNENNIFGETGQDEIDLFPDVHIGRLPCDEIKDVEVVVDKIIHYEDETFYQDWFNNMIFIGGNTFRWNPGNEGEENNEIIMEIMSDFNPSYIIWTSKNNYNRKTISEAINAGAGFLDYSGHGYEHGMGTYAPHGIFLKSYFIPYIEDLINGYKLPIMFFDACLTAKLDFILQDLLDYKIFRSIDIIAKIINYDTSINVPCYAWCFIKHEGGGSIASIGATRTAFGGIDSGAGKMSIEFFSNYKNSDTLGQMMTKAQNAYIIDVPEDEFTLEEFILLGDPSLKIGGYS